MFPTTNPNEQATPTVLIPNQNIFLSAVMSALRHDRMRHLHEKWLQMISSSLPYFGENTRQITISCIHQICNNIEQIAREYSRETTEGAPCPDYAVTQLSSLTVLCHYCLLDSGGSNTTNNNNTPTEILNNLVSAFFAPVGLDLSAISRQNGDHYNQARKTVLSHMPRIISSVAKLWQTVVGVVDGGGVLGCAKLVKQQLLEFLSPIAVHHGASFLAAVAVAWYERKNLFGSVKTVIFIFFLVLVCLNFFFRYFQSRIRVKIISFILFRLFVSFR